MRYRGGIRVTTYEGCLASDKRRQCSGSGTIILAAAPWPALDAYSRPDCRVPFSQSETDLDRKASSSYFLFGCMASATLTPSLLSIAISMEF